MDNLVGYPSFQATWQDGKYNFTVRGEDAKTVVVGLVEIKNHATSMVAFKGDFIDTPEVVSEKCPQCESSMHSKVITSKKDGNKYNVYECNNSNCKNEKGYRTTIFPKK